MDNIFKKKLTMEYFLLFVDVERLYFRPAKFKIPREAGLLDLTFFRLISYLTLTFNLYEKGE